MRLSVKKLFAVLISLIICLSAFGITALADAIDYDSYGIHVDGEVGVGYEAYIASTGININLREGPGSDYAIIRTIPNFSKVYVYAEYNGWGKVMFTADGYYDGWLFLNHLLKELPISSTDMDVVVSAHSGGGTSFRSGPATSYGKLRTDLIPDGTELHITKICSHPNCDHSWGVTEYEGKEGWVCLWETVPVDNDPQPIPDPITDPEPAPDPIVPPAEENNTETIPSTNPPDSNDNSGSSVFSDMLGLIIILLVIFIICISLAIFFVMKKKNDER